MYGNFLVSAVFCIGIILFLIWLGIISSDTYDQSKELERELTRQRATRLLDDEQKAQEQEQKELKQTVRAKPKKVPVFIDAEEDEEDYEEAPEKPEFRYAYDPVSHSVKRVPFDD